MTLEFTDVPSPNNDREHSATPPLGRAVLPPTFEKIKETYDEDIEKQSWENEGGADLDGHNRRNHWIDRIDHNPIALIVDDAYERFERDELDKATDAVHAAVNQYVDCREIVRELVDYAIKRLSTAGGPATPPHPAARRLVIERRDLAI